MVKESKGAKMIKNLKLKGVSLVEVMVMMGVLSVILAASMTMITKKTIPVAKKVPHGVYRCIYNPDTGRNYEEMYNYSSRVKSGDVNKCTFKVPKAAMYRVDIYSAGSGGNLSARIDSNIASSPNTALYTLDNINTNANSNVNQLYVPGDKDFYNFLNGTYYVDSMYTGDAGFGGAISVKYPSVLDSSCLRPYYVEKLKEKIQSLKDEIAWLENISYSGVVQASGNWAYTLPVVGPAGLKAIIPNCWYVGMSGGAPDYDCNSPDLTYSFTNKTFYTLYTTPYTLARLFCCEDRECDDDNEWSWNNVDGNLKKALNLIAKTLENSTYSYGKYSFQDVKKYINDAKNDVYNDRLTSGMAEEHFNWDNSGGDNEWNSAHNLTYATRRSESNTRALFGVRDDDGYDGMSWTWGVRFKYLVDDMIDGAVKRRIKELKEELKIWESMLDLPQNEYFLRTYNKKSVWNDEVDKQLTDYCYFTFKPLYKYAGVNTLETARNQAMNFNHTRRIANKGGNEGVGKVSVLMYQIGSSYKKGDDFRTYASQIKSTHKPRACKSNNTSDCEVASSFERAYDSNLNYLPVYAPSSSNQIYDAKVRYNYKDQKDKINRFRTSGKKRYAVVQDGGSLSNSQQETKVFSNESSTEPQVYKKDLKPYLFWDFPSYEGGPVAAIQTQATGGKAPQVYIDESNTAKYTLPSNCNKATWTCNSSYPAPASVVFVKNGVYKNLAYSVNGSDGANGTDVILKDLSASYYRIKAIEENQIRNVVLTSTSQTTMPKKQEPRYTTQSWIWSKKYKLGPSGKVGKLVSSVETILGDECEFDIARPGKVYRPNADDINLLTSKLSTTVVCKTRDGKPAFSKTVKGNGYNTGLVSEGYVNNNTYTWNKNINENGGVWNVSLASSAPQTNWSPTSIWAKVFKNKMFSGGSYDIKSRYNVGAAGNGTTLNDYCLVRKGKYNTYVDYVVSYLSNNSTKRSRNSSFSGYDDFCNYEFYENSYDSNDSCKFNSSFSFGWSEDSLSDYLGESIISDPSRSQTKIAPGTYKGFDCYGASGSNATTGSMTLYDDSPIVRSGLININASSGGGGAVVITW